MPQLSQILATADWGNQQTHRKSEENIVPSYWLIFSGQKEGCARTFFLEILHFIFLNQTWHGVDDRTLGGQGCVDATLFSAGGVTACEPVAIIRLGTVYFSMKRPISEFRKTLAEFSKHTVKHWLLGCCAQGPSDPLVSGPRGGFRGGVNASPGKGGRGD